MSTREIILRESNVRHPRQALIVLTAWPLKPSRLLEVNLKKKKDLWGVKRSNNILFSFHQELITYFLEKKIKPREEAEEEEEENEEETTTIEI